MEQAEEEGPVYHRTLSTLVVPVHGLEVESGEVAPGRRSNKNPPK